MRYSQAAVRDCFGPRTCSGWQGDRVSGSLSCSRYQEYGSCPKKQESEVRRSRVHPTELACLQELFEGKTTVPVPMVSTTYPKPLSIDIVPVVGSSSSGTSCLIKYFLLLGSPWFSSLSVGGGGMWKKCVPNKTKTSTSLSKADQITTAHLWETGKFGIQSFRRLTITGWSSNWLSMDKKLSRLLLLKTLTLDGPSSLCRQCSRDRFTLWNDSYWTWRKSYSYFDLETFGLPLSHVKCRKHDHRFPLSLWEVWFWSNLGVPIPVFIGPPQQCSCNDFHYDLYGDPFLN